MGEVAATTESSKEELKRSEEPSADVSVRYGDATLLHKINLIWFAMALFCIPVWWKTTTVTRYEIPYDTISQLDVKTKQLNLSQKRNVIYSTNKMRYNLNCLA